MENSLDSREFPTPGQPAPIRRAYIDWLRGIAVLFMIEWHTVDAWNADPERARTVFATLAYIGGWAAPLFLFLAGVAVPLAAASHARKGRSSREAAWALQKRGWQIFVIAHLFRLQSFILNPWARIDSIFKPDILNILGLGLVVAAWCWGRSARLTRRLAWLLLPAGAIVLLTPLSREWGWPTMLHLRLEAYIRPNGGWGVFTIFPWLAYVLVGAAVGVWLVQPRAASREPLFHALLALAGLGVIAAGFLGSSLPSLTPASQGGSTFSYFVSRNGIMMVALDATWWLLETPGAQRMTRWWGPVLTFGRTSLFVYWIHVELAYGFFSTAWKRSMTIEEWSLAYVAFTAMLYWAAAWWAKRTTTPWVPGHLKSTKA